MTTLASPPPAIEPVLGDGPRPLWSVMIPTYNCAGSLRETLASVLAQGVGAADMQIEVVDDGSTDDPAAVVQELGQGRVTFFRGPENLGPAGNFTRCAQRARGRWVHILHGDDFVLPGFYASLRAECEREEAGAALCRAVLCDERGIWTGLSAPIQPQRGRLVDPVRAIFVRNPVATPAIVVRRETYEALGGFRPVIPHTADWDLWKRIAARHPIRYVPQPLAVYRVHPLSDTSRLVRTAENIRQELASIEIATGYLDDAALARRIAREARRASAAYALRTAKQLAKRGDGAAARAQLRAALACDRSPKTLWRSAALYLRLLRRRSTRAPAARPAPPAA